jgi:hypothetical protein
MRLFLAITAICLATGCANQAVVERCLSEDWYAVGYQDAKRGHGTQQLLAHQNVCTQHGITPHRSSYLDGWLAGRGLTAADPS